RSAQRHHPLRGSPAWSLAAGTARGGGPISARLHGAAKVAARRGLWSRTELHRTEQGVEDAPLSKVESETSHGSEQGPQPVALRSGARQVDGKESGEQRSDSQEGSRLSPVVERQAQPEPLPRHHHRDGRPGDRPRSPPPTPYGPPGPPQQ